NAAGNLIAEDEGCVEIVETDPAAESGQGNSADNGVAAASDDTETDDADSSVISVSDADSFAEAVSTANASESAITIQLTDDVALDTSAIFSGIAAVTLDLAGHAITRGSSTTGYLIGIGSGSNLTVTDSVGEGYIDGATYTVDGTTYVGYSILTNGTLALNSGTLKGYYGLYISGSDANVTISGSGAVEGTSRGISMNSGTLTVEAGTITGGTYGMVQFTGETTINGGTIGSAGEGRGIQHQGGNLTINDGTVLGEYAVTSNAYNADTTLTVTGGIIGNTSDSTDDLSSMALVGVFVIGSKTTYDATADISGGTITAYDSGVYIQGNVAAGETSEKESYNATVTVSDDAVIETVYNSTYGYSDSGVSVWGKGAVLNVEGGTISSGVFAIAGNGTYNTSGSGYSNAGTVINISDGKISSAGTAIYHPQDGTINISGGTISGYTAGIEIRAGELTVKDGSIESTFTPLAYLANGSGTTVLGAALAVSQHTTKLPITVNISGGSFEGFYGVFENNVQENTYDSDDLYTKYEDYINVYISGGKFYTTWGLEAINEINETEGANISTYGEAVYGTSEDTMIITGGYYNAEPNVQLADGYSYATSTTDEYTYYVTNNEFVGCGMDLASGIVEMEIYVKADATDINMVTGVVTDETTHTDLGSVGTCTVDGTAVSCYTVTQRISPAYMNTLLTVKIQLSNGYEVVRYTSVRQFAVDLLGDEYADNLDDLNARVLIAMLNYGAAVQQYLDSSVSSSDLANSGYAYTDDYEDSNGTAFSNITYSYLKSYAPLRVSYSDVSYNGISLEDIVLGSLSDFTVTFEWTESLEDYTVGEDLVIRFDGEVADNYVISSTKIVFSGLSAEDLMKEIVITFKDSNGNTCSWTTTGLYTARFLANSSDSIEQFLGKSIYLYSDAVKALAKSITDESEATVVMGTLYEEPNFEVVIFDESDIETSISDPSGGASTGTGGNLMYDDD
ncbi:MAG: hypothetical protein LUE21_01235, partial [Oscillospiraceae bacterium]|nr:hypothetical protein [Oscillospiraceae bacterium]